ncbi:MAG TPA: hypothetical protein VFW11_12530 [Cyclobacteriaceae bacterium]|nr:hypothetical protein [Cyclobacteriaceae bacterium]
MKRTIYILLFAGMITSMEVDACDVCGCSLGGGYFGILPQFNKNFVGLRWSQAKFYSYMNHQSEYTHDEYSNDTYNKVELWGRFYINPKLQLFTFIPYNYNQMEGSEQNVTASGMGDVSLIANYLLINTGMDTIKLFKQTLSLGGGVKLPTGKYNLADQGALVNENFQMGTGSTDFVISAMYTLRYKQIGSNFETGYKINTANQNDYRFGNQFHASYQLFYWQNLKGIALLPNAGVYYEQGDYHKDDGIIQSNTGGSALLATVGLETYFGQFTVGFNYKHPLVQHFNSDNVADIQSKDRFVVALTFNF